MGPESKSKLPSAGSFYLQGLPDELSGDATTPVVGMASQGEHVVDLVHLREVTENIGWNMEAQS